MILFLFLSTRGEEVGGVRSRTLKPKSITKGSSLCILLRSRIEGRIARTVRSKESPVEFGSLIEEGGGGGGRGGVEVEFRSGE